MRPAGVLFASLAAWLLWSLPIVVIAEDAEAKEACEAADDAEAEMMKVQLLQNRGAGVRRGASHHELQQDLNASANATEEAQLGRAGRRGLGEWAQCGNSTFNGFHDYGECDEGLICVLPAQGATNDTPSICHKICGSYTKESTGVVDDHVDASITCLPGDQCSGYAATPCGGGPAQVSREVSCPEGKAAKLYMFCWGN